MHDAPIVVVGSGLAGYSLARELRKLDGAVPLVLVTRDDGAVYSKPMLSNALVAQRTPAMLATADAAGAAEQFGATVLAQRTVEAIDVARNTVRLDAGEGIAYRKLVLALGADPIRLPLEGDAADAVLSVNDLGDYARFRETIETARHVTILGAGLIGCEFANDLKASGREVDVVEPAAWPLSRLVPAAVGEAFAKRLRDAGVRLRLGASAVAATRRDGGGLRLRLVGDEAIDTDVVLSAVGLRPRTELASAAGLRTARGIVVDRFLRTSAADVHALGDCAEVEGLVLPFVMPIMHAARALARTLCGEPTRLRYPAMPVVVKTPAAPLTVAPPPAGADGSLEATFIDPDGALLGFALLGGTPAARQALTRRLPAVLD